MATRAKPNQVPISEFKAHCLALVEQVRARGVGFVITRRGLPVAQLSPLPSAEPRGPTFGRWKGGSVHGDIVHTDWSALFEASRTTR